MIKNLNGKRIIIGITGSIAAYKSAYLTRLLLSSGAEVQVVMSQSATDFIAPLTFQALTNRPVYINETEGDSASGMLHIDLAKWADIIVIAPATTDFIARLSLGRANNLLNTICLAFAGRLFVAPAMNQQMWQQTATKKNTQTLTENGVIILPPDSGEQACGDVGSGRMMQPEAIIQQISANLETGLLSGKTILITAGATRESIDPMRFLSNKSTGKMAYALAEAAIEMGASVQLVSGAVSAVVPERADNTIVQTADEMLAVVLGKIPDADWFIGVAAVADYRPIEPSLQKIKKLDETINLALTLNPDILKTVAFHKNRPKLVIGFAAETDNIQQNAQVKLTEKKVDAIIANQIGVGLGAGEDDNQVSILWQNGMKNLPLSSKRVIARQILENLTTIFG